MNDAYKPFDVNVKGFADMTEEELEAFWEANQEEILSKGKRITIFQYIWPYDIFDGSLHKAKIKKYSRKNIRRK